LRPDEMRCLSVLFAGTSNNLLVFRLPRFAGKGRFDAPFIYVAIVVGRSQRLPHVRKSLRLLRTGG
jgi:hypothetical protein